MQNSITDRTIDPSAIDPGLETLAALMDDRFRIFGFRFGLNFVLDLIPEVGDIVTTIIAVYIFFSAIRYGVSRWNMLRMAWNILVYFIVGLIPWIGDIFGAWWKPNKRNLDIVRRSLQDKAGQAFGA